MLVACQLVNQTTWEQARPALREIMGRYDIYGLAHARPRMLHGVLRPLGLWRRRADLLVRMAEDWVIERPRTGEDVERMAGCGLYARHSWEIFVEGRIVRGATDHKLRWYLSECRRRGATPASGPRRASRAR